MSQAIWTAEVDAFQCKPSKHVMPGAEVWFIGHLRLYDLTLGIWCGQIQYLYNKYIMIYNV